MREELDTAYECYVAITVEKDDGTKDCNTTRPMHSAPQTRMEEGEGVAGFGKFS